MNQMKFPRLLTALTGLAMGAASATLSSAEDDEKVYPIGYSDTPTLPNSEWKVHDIDRPRPEVVTPGKTAADAPADAIVLFDGTDLSKWHGEKETKNAEGKTRRTPDKDTAAKWKIEDSYVEMTPTGNIFTREAFGDCQLHIEWSSPAEPQSNSQHRGNSGIFLMDRYEVQVLDCYDNMTYADGQAGAAYGQNPPLVNATREPGEWQTYDIIFRAPRFLDGKLESPATITILLNGVLVQNHFALLGPTTHRAVATYSPHPEKAPLRLQDHNDNQPVRFRNIWIRPL
ncbi:MAG: hypothetical protein ACI9R3_003799 [Verrucomicrobiales bacterium]|jgi:hypothetical protein